MLPVQKSSAYALIVFVALSWLALLMGVKFYLIFVVYVERICVVRPKIDFQSGSRQFALACCYMETEAWQAFAGSVN